MIYLKYTPIIFLNLVYRLMTWFGDLPPFRIQHEHQIPLVRLPSLYWRTWHYFYIQGSPAEKRYRDPLPLPLGWERYDPNISYYE